MAALAVVPADAPWTDVVAAIDAMPGGPTWQEVERTMDALIVAHIREEEKKAGERGESLGAIRNQWIRNDTVGDWRSNVLAKVNEPVADFLHAHRRARQQLIGKMSTLIWFRVHFTPSDVNAIGRALRIDWNRADNRGGDLYALRHISTALAQQILQWPQEIGSTRVLSAIDEQRFQADLRAHVMRPRTELAQSGVIDMIAARQGPDVAQSIARLIAPETITHQRPLAIRPMPTPAFTPATHREYLASILDVMRTPDAQAAPTATLARAGAMLDTLMQSIEQQQQQQ